ncbi:MAG: MBL fold metallo-hydrolase [Bacteroidales bacterium]|jgi:phosphoribosyl 1,2-cyclic phosphodiesterase|nr:MBL fold metallo-hydrolase [Bacteroidales bacterium]
MVEICALASGSNGNCYYIGNSTNAVLIDAGISCRQVLLRMAAKNLDPAKVKAIFVSHEHADHCSGIGILSKRLGIPAYMTSRTRGCIRSDQQATDIQEFAPGDTIIIGNFSIHSFLKKHDAAEPCSFRIEYEGTSVGVFTDIGLSCNRVRHHLSQCHALFLESNYDEEMLRTGSYPYYLKARISSDYGHLSNRQAMELLRQHHHPALQVVLLSHLSAENNRPEIAASAFDELRARFTIEVTDRYAASKVYTVKEG